MISNSLVSCNISVNGTRETRQCALCYARCYLIALPIHCYVVLLSSPSPAHVVKACCSLYHDPASPIAQPRDASHSTLLHPSPLPCQDALVQQNIDSKWFYLSPYNYSPARKSKPIKSQPPLASVPRFLKPHLAQSCRYRPQQLELPEESAVAQS